MSTMTGLQDERNNLLRENLRLKQYCWTLLAIAAAMFIKWRGWV